MQAKIRGINSNTGDEVDVKVTPYGQVLTLPPQIIWTAKGYGFQAMATSAVAALVVRPTTTAMVTLYNNSTDKNLVIERAFGHNLVAAAQSDYGLYLCSHPAGMTAPTNDITIRNSTNGVATSTAGIMDVGATVVDNGWFPWGSSYTTVTVTTPGGLLEAVVGGRIIVPPTGGISLQVVASVTGATFTCGFHWFAVPTTELPVG